MNDKANNKYTAKGSKLDLDKKMGVVSKRPTPSFNGTFQRRNDDLVDSQNKEKVSSREVPRESAPVSRLTSNTSSVSKERPKPSITKRSKKGGIAQPKSIRPYENMEEDEDDQKAAVVRRRTSILGATPTTTEDDDSSDNEGENQEGENKTTENKVPENKTAPNVGNQPAEVRPAGTEVGVAPLTHARKVLKTGQLIVKYKWLIIAVLAGGIIIIFFMIFIILTSSSGAIATLNNLKTECNYNLTTVNYSCDGNNDNVTIDKFVKGSAFAYMNDYISSHPDAEFSDGAMRAMMIAIKTSALGLGNYNSKSKRVSLTCSLKYSDYDDIPTDMKNTLDSNYEDIEDYLYISESYKDAITTLSGASMLSLADDKIEAYASSGFKTYEAILKQLYGPNDSDTEKDETVTVPTNNNETIYIGDSRMAGMTLNGVVDDSHSSYRGANGYCWFSYNTSYSNGCSPFYWGNSNDEGRLGGANLASSKIKDGQSYNILVWLGVNDLGNINHYFEAYKGLAQNEWKNHTVYIAQVGPVNESMYDTSSYRVVNQEVIDFNNKMAQMVNEAGISNLIYLDLGLNQDFIDWSSSDGVHYSVSDYRKILELMKSGMGSAISANKALYNLKDYCNLSGAYDPCSGGNNTGWWYPKGSEECTTDSSGTIFCSGEPELSSSQYANDYISDYCETKNCRPNVGVTNQHYGIDMWAPCGSNVIAPKDGVVTIAYDDGCPDHNDCGGCTCGRGAGFGNVIYIDHGDGITSIYGHLQTGTFKVKAGDHVKQGQLLAKSGSSGSSTGCHLHFQMQNNNGTFDPYDGYVDPYNPRMGAQVCANSYTADQKGACQALKDMGLSDAAVAAFLNNMSHESGYATNVLEYAYWKGKCTTVEGRSYGWCMSPLLQIEDGRFANSDAYTAGVDSGEYPEYNFVNDHAGYGLIQWTYKTRKQGLYDYFQELKSSGRASSISDINVQIGFILQEIQSGDSALYNMIQNSSNASDIAYNICYSYETPSGYSTGTCSSRISDINNQISFVKNGCSD